MRSIDKKRATDREYYHRKAQKCKESGICGKCWKNVDRPGLLHCDACILRAQLAADAYRHFAGPCVLCGFEYSDVHHKDGNHDNNSPDNLISLCPNHHRLIHMGLLKAS